mmetsp:Transcript_47089/g.54551  ORF Transcript_47089/g.54551 Transcript_47089/m.54551 type:complete len:102 (-) Transcript_47089:134-439(-)
MRENDPEAGVLKGEKKRKVKRRRKFLRARAEVLLLTASQEIRETTKEEKTQVQVTVVRAQAADLLAAVLQILVQTRALLAQDRDLKVRSLDICIENWEIHT